MARESLWVLHASGRLLRIDQPTGEVTVERGLAAAAGCSGTPTARWSRLVARGFRAVRVAPDSGAIEAQAELPARGAHMALHDGAPWVACTRRFAPHWGCLTAIDLATMTVASTLDLPSASRAIVAGTEHLWMPAVVRRQEQRDRPASNRLTRWAETEWTIYDLALDEDRLLAVTGLALVGPGMAAEGGSADAGGAAGGN